MGPGPGNVVVMLLTWGFLRRADAQNVWGEVSGVATNRIAVKPLLRNIYVMFNLCLMVLAAPGASSKFRQDVDFFTRLAKRCVPGPVNASASIGNRPQPVSTNRKVKCV
jgi:hypothetical protein